MNGTAPIKPSPWYYMLAAPFLAAGLGLFVYALWHGVSHMTDSLTQVVVPGEAELALKHGPAYTVFLEQHSVVNGKIYSTDESVDGLACKVIARSTGEAVPIGRPSSSMTYEVGGRSGHSVLEFRVPEDGAYNFNCGYGEGVHGPETVLAVGSGFGEGLATTIFGSVVAMLGGGVSALVVVLVVFFLRERAKKRLLAVT